MRALSIRIALFLLTLLFTSRPEKKHSSSANAVFRSRLHDLHLPVQQTRHTDLEKF